MSIKRYVINDIDDSSELKPNFSRKDLDSFMLTLDDLPKYIRKDIYTKLLDKAVTNELNEMAKKLSTEFIPLWLRQNTRDIYLIITYDIQRFIELYVDINDYEVLIDRNKDPLTLNEHLRIIIRTKFLAFKKQIVITIN